MAPLFVALLLAAAAAAVPVLRAPTCPVVLPTDATPRIIGGGFASPDTRTRMVSFYEEGCGGTILSPTWVLTAAHCLVDELSTARVHGDHSSNGVEIPVARVFNHPEYVFPKDDIALVELQSPVPPSSAFMPLNANPQVPLDGEFARVAGYGFQKEGFDDTHDAILRQVDVPIMNTQKCIDSYFSVNSYLREDISVDMHLCAGYDKGGCDSCTADSGGPLFVFDDDNNPIQIAIVSFGYGCAREVPGGYSRVSTYIPWMKSVGAVFQQATTRKPYFADTVLAASEPDSDDPDIEADTASEDAPEEVPAAAAPDQVTEQAPSDQQSEPASVPESEPPSEQPPEPEAEPQHEPAPEQPHEPPSEFPSESTSESTSEPLPSNPALAAQPAGAPAQVPSPEAVSAFVTPSPTSPPVVSSNVVPEQNGSGEEPASPVPSSKPSLPARPPAKEVIATPPPNTSVPHTGAQGVEEPPKPVSSGSEAAISEGKEETTESTSTSSGADSAIKGDEDNEIGSAGANSSHEGDQTPHESQNTRPTGGSDTEDSATTSSDDSNNEENTTTADASETGGGETPTGIVGPVYVPTASPEGLMPAGTMDAEFTEEPEPSSSPDIDGQADDLAGGSLGALAISMIVLGSIVGLVAVGYLFYFASTRK